ncbi:MAG: hypothetical protein RIC14_07655 [Filomicrobium sp.]
MESLSELERRLIVAMHEAGHAVTCVELSVPFGGVAIAGAQAGDAQGDAAVNTEAFRIERALDGHQDEVARCRSQVIVCLAGRIAEEHAFGAGLTKAVGLNSGAQDERDARRFAKTLAMSELRKNRAAEIDYELLPQLTIHTLAACRSAASSIVKRRFAAIEAVGRALADAGALTACDVDALAKAHPTG